MNYQQSTIAGQAWTRSNRVVCENPYEGGTPAITFAEERLISLPDGIVTKPAGSVSEPLTADNRTEAFDLVHPETGAVIGSTTYQDVYVMLASLYAHVATKRDAATSA